MNNICKSLEDSLRDEFEIEVDGFFSKQRSSSICL